MRRIHFVVFALLLAVPAAAQGKWDTIPEKSPDFRAIVDRFRKEPVVKGKILFLGNSITEGGKWKRLLKDSSVINRGISGDITYGILYRIDDVVKRQPSKVFLLIGINDLAKGIPDEIIMENIFSIARKIKTGSPKTTVYIQSILPTSTAFPNFPNHKNKGDHITTINAQLRRYGDKLGYTFVDLYPEFLNGDGQLDSKLTYDGLHLNYAGYEKWVSFLKTKKYL